MTTDESSVHILGIRHHGPGSARSVRRALDELQPDIVLVEGPPEADAALPLMVEEGMEPPVALLVYRPDQPRQAVYYPFAVFSPEWQALDWSLRRAVPTRFIDLPQSHTLAVRQIEFIVEFEAQPPDEQEKPSGDNRQLDSQEEPEPEPEPAWADPLGWLAKAAGYSDGERWWEQLVEHRQDSAGLFEAILEAMTVLRRELPPRPDPDNIEAQREAFMRQSIRAARREGYQKIAVICGAWHAPALAEAGSTKADAALLKDLPKVKVQATWVPWTYGRLTFASGYGAGIEAPGWYHHLWTWPDLVAARWLTRVARLLRSEDVDVSSAHVIEGVRLAEALAALRDRPLPGLVELNEAALAVLCGGNDAPMQLVHQQLIVGERLGQIPPATPLVPLQQDLIQEQRRLRLKPEAGSRTLDLDQRKPLDLERSLLLHRLNLLELPWGQLQRAANQRGTFHELWQLQWQPEFAVRLIEAGVWGVTVREAAAGRARRLADEAEALPVLTALLDRALLAGLSEAANHLIQRLQNMAALAGDVGHLMDALPPLANVMRYGNVRQADTGLVGQVVNGLVARTFIGLPGACASLNHEAAEAMYSRLHRFNAALDLLQKEEMLEEWRAVLLKLTDQRALHGLIAGRCCRILLDSGAIEPEEAARRMGLALSTAGEPVQAAAWVEGFLKGSGLLLLHDPRLWQVLDEWVNGLATDSFTALLPLLRRTFATFSAPERRQMGEQAKRQPGSRPAAGSQASNFDRQRAEAVLPLLAQLLGRPEVLAGSTNGVPG